jgi:hypothetical protein
VRSKLVELASAAATAPASATSAIEIVLRLRAMGRWRVVAGQLLRQRTSHFPGGQSSDAQVSLTIAITIDAIRQATQIIIR